jgi:hypothetical protein
MKKLLLFLLLFPLVGLSQVVIGTGFEIGASVPTNVNDTCNTVANLSLKTNVAEGQLTYVLADSSIYQMRSVGYSKLEFSRWSKTGSDIYYSIGKVGIGIAAPTESLEIYGGKLKFSDGATNGLINLIKVRNTDYLRIYGALTTGFSFVLGGYANGAFAGDDETDMFYSSLIGGRCGANILHLEESNIIGGYSAYQTSSHELIAYRVTSIGAYNLYNMGTIGADDSIFLENVTVVGNHNGESLEDSSANIILIGDGLLNLVDKSYFPGVHKNLTIIGSRPGDYGGYSLDMPGSIVVSNSDDSASYVNFNVDEILQNGIPLTSASAGWGIDDDTTYTANHIVIGGTDPENESMLTVYGSVFFNGTVDGTYITHPATDNMFFGESLEVTDSTSMIVELIAGETISIGELLYTDTDFKLYLADNDVDSSARVQYIAYSDADADDPILVVIPSSFIKNTSWNFNIGYVYLSGTAGGLTQTVDTDAGDWVTEIGWASSDSTMFFYPTVALKND